MKSHRSHLDLSKDNTRSHFEKNGELIMKKLSILLLIGCCLPLQACSYIVATVAIIEGQSSSSRDPNPSTPQIQSVDFVAAPSSAGRPTDLTQAQAVVSFSDNDSKPVNLTVEVLASQTVGGSLTVIDSLTQTRSGVATSPQTLTETFSFDFSTANLSGLIDAQLRVSISDGGQAATTTSLVTTIGNEAPSLSNVVVIQNAVGGSGSSGTVPISFDIEDSSLDSVTVAVEYKLEGEADSLYRPIEVQIGTLTGLAAGSPGTPTRQTVAWNSLALLGAAGVEGGVGAVNNAVQPAGVKGQTVNVLFRLTPRDGSGTDIFAQGQGMPVVAGPFLIDNNERPRCSLQFENIDDRTRNIRIPFTIDDSENDSIVPLLQYRLTNQSFADIDANDPALNPHINLSDPDRDSIEDRAVLDAVLADTALRRRLQILTESPGQVRGVVRAGSTATLVIEPALMLNRRPGIVGGTLKIGSASAVVTSFENGRFSLAAPGLSPAPSVGDRFVVELAPIQGRELASAPAAQGGQQHALIWDSSADIPVATRIALQLRVFEVQSAALREGIATTTTSEAIPVGGRLKGAPSISVANEPNYVETVDFNGDGLDDLIALGGSGDMQIFLQTGDGLVLHQSFDVGLDDPRNIATGDVNGDGRLDVATAPQANNNGRVYLQDAQGNLDTVNFLEFSVGAANPPFGPNVIWIELGDINGDGRDDLVMSSSSQSDFIIFVQNAQGQLEAAANSPFPGSRSQERFTIADVNGDGRNDLISIDDADRELNVYLQDAQGGLAAAPYSPIPTQPSRELVVGDLNGDGFNDVAAVNQDAAQVTVFLQDPVTHALAEANFSPLGSDDRPLSLNIGDFDGNGLNDLAVVSDSFNTLQIYRQRDGMLRREQSSLSTDARPFGVTVGDFDSNGQADLVVSGFAADTLQIFHQNGQAALQLQTVGPNNAGVRAVHMSIEDLNGDGLNDVIITDFFGSQLLIYEQNRLGKLSEAPRILSLPGRVGIHVVGDFNGDSRPDIAVTDTDGATLTVYFQDAQGNLSPGPALPIASFVFEMCKGDFNGDGRMDLAAGGFSTGEVTLYYQQAQGGFGAAVQLPSANSPVPAAADINGDGLDDLIVGNFSAAGLDIYLQDGSGNLVQTSTQLLTDDRARTIIPSDLNGDGRMDISVLGTTTDRVRRLIQDAQGNFVEGGSSEVLVAGSLFDIAQGDINGDGLADYGIADGFGASTQAIVGNRLNGLSPINPAINAGVEVLAIAIGDLNGDGKDDLITASADDFTPKLVVVYLQE